tara:strand:+ start:7968 stop:8102 length:135 start_codon:yes stop_codon:yes gene_type:complete
MTDPKDYKLEERLWFEIATRLTRLGDVTGVKYKVVPREPVKHDG